jgi:hypothetical protein
MARQQIKTLQKDTIPAAAATATKQPSSAIPAPCIKFQTRWQSKYVNTPTHIFTVDRLILVKRHEISDFDQNVQMMMYSDFVRRVHQPVTKN